MITLIGRVAGLIAMSFLLTGCFLRTLIGGVGTFPEDEIIVRLGSDTNMATCVRTVGEDGHIFFDCTYWLVDEATGFIFDVVSTVELISDFGIAGIVIDPLILQIPDDATDISGRFTTDGTTWDDLVITAAASFKADAATTVTAEPGYQFLIIELPDDVAASIPEGSPPGDPRTGMLFGFDLQFRLASSRAIQVKPVFAIRIDTGGETFYAPMVPCVTDFANVPAIDVPVANAMQWLIPEAIEAVQSADAAGTLACDGKVYDFRQGAPPPPPPPPPAGSAIIDVKPGSDENPVNPGSRGVIPVAILTTSTADGEAFDFDASSVDPATVRFGPDGAAEAHGRGHIEDVDGDGDDDLMLHFRTRASGIACGDTSVTLTGSTVGGDDFEGTDSIRTVGCD